MKLDTHHLQACKDDRMLIYRHCLLIDGTLNYALYEFFCSRGFSVMTKYDIVQARLPFKYTTMN